MKKAMKKMLLWSSKRGDGRNRSSQICMLVAVSVYVMGTALAAHADSAVSSSVSSTATIGSVSTVSVSTVSTATNDPTANSMTDKQDRSVRAGALKSDSIVLKAADFAPKSAKSKIMVVDLLFPKEKMAGKNDGKSNKTSDDVATHDLKSVMAMENDLWAYQPMPNLYAYHKGKVVPLVSDLVGVALRLGAELSPRGKFDAGVDVTLPRLSIAPHFVTRIDGDAIVSANFGGVTTLVPVTFDQIYRYRLPGGSSIYGGVGIGPYFGEVTRFGGKLILGGTITPNFGLEGAVHFTGYGDALYTIQVRFPII